jgi:UDP-N-acetylmuramoyl-tripeptide--D-alanyl-D-alanine ligase
MPQYSPADLAEWSGGSWTTVPQGVIDGVSNDTRSITAGNLYFALLGTNFDGHDFVADAFRKGASAAVVLADRDLPSSAGMPLLRVRDTGKALCDIAAAYRVRSAPEIVAITGSAGKSTVKEMIAQVLSPSMPTARSKGNWNNNIGLPLSILAMEKSSRIGVFEIGTNHPGELAPLCRILKPSWGVVTNIGKVHIEFFGSLEAIADEKATLLRSLPADGVAVLNRDGGCFDLLRAAVPCKTTTVSFRQDADYVCVGYNHADRRASIKEKATGDKFDFHLPVPGEHNISNAMLAIAVARGHQLDWDKIRGPIAHYSPLPMRWQKEEIGGIEIINDAYNANPMSMRAAISAYAQETTAGGKWLLLSGMLELGDSEKSEHAALGQFVAGGKWKGLVVAGELGNLIAQGAEQAGFSRRSIFRCDTNDEAANVLLKNMRDGDAVLLKASRRMRLEEVIEKLKQAERA